MAQGYVASLAPRVKPVQKFVKPWARVDHAVVFASKEHHCCQALLEIDITAAC